MKPRSPSTTATSTAGSIGPALAPDVQPGRPARRVRRRRARAGLPRPRPQAAAADAQALAEAKYAARARSTALPTPPVPAWSARCWSAASVARSLAYAWGARRSAFIIWKAICSRRCSNRRRRFPFLALLVSGGHTMLADRARARRLRDPRRSLDDAAGEAFDKSAKLLGLPYPGGPALAKLAHSRTARALQVSAAHARSPGLEFSFSGLKTAVVVATRGVQLDDATRADIAREFQQAIVDTLVAKCRARSSRPAVERWSSPAASARTRLARKRSRRSAASAACTVLLSAAGVLHRQCRDDRVRRLCRLAGRRARRPAIRATARWPLDTLRPPPHDS